VQIGAKKPLKVLLSVTLTFDLRF